MAAVFPQIALIEFKELPLWKSCLADHLDIEQQKSRLAEFAMESHMINNTFSTVFDKSGRDGWSW